MVVVETDILLKHVDVKAEVCAATEAPATIQPLMVNVAQRKISAERITPGLSNATSVASFKIL